MIADLARLAWTFGWLSLICIGGGLGVVPEMRRQVVDHYQWVTAREFVDGYTLSQLTPGPSMLVAVFVGYRAQGIAGAAVAGLAMFLPTSLLAAVVARHWAALRHRPWAAAVEEGLLPIGLGLMAAGVYTLARAGIHDPATGAIAVGAGLILWTRSFPAILVVAAGGFLAWLTGL